MKKTTPKIGNHGVSLVEVSIAGLVFIFAFTALLQIVEKSVLTTAKTNRRVDSHQILTQLALEIERMPFKSLIALCKDKNAWQQDATGSCASGALSSGTGPLLGITLANDGSFSSNGKACVELSRCDPRAEGSAIEAKLTLFREDITKPGTKFTENLKILRVRW